MPTAHRLRAGSAGPARRVRPAARASALLGAAALLVPGAGASAQEAEPPPIIDMHLHALPIDFQGPPPQTICAPFRILPAWDPRDSYPAIFGALGDDPGCALPLVSPMTADEVRVRTLEILERRNIVGVTSGPPELVERWRQAAPGRIIPGLSIAVSTGSPSPDQLRAWHHEGRLEVLAEVIDQYRGVAPDDPRFEPYLALAEELDLPVGIHVGTGPPGAPYLGNPGYRARMHSPLSLEEPLLRHPKLRVYLMHAGWPMLDDTLALLWTHPQVYVGIGVIDYVLPRAEFHRYLRRLVEAGFGNRILFGSDQMIWPQAIERALDAVETADFLSPEQKRAILYENAARFLRLDEASTP